MKIHLFAAMASIIAQANAAVIFDNLSAKSDRGIVSWRAAQSFLTTENSLILTAVQLIGYGSAQDIEISLYSNNGTFSRPSSKLVVLFSGSADEAGFHTITTRNTPTTFSIPQFAILPNQRYWIVLQNNSNTDIWWGDTNSNLSYGEGYTTYARNSLTGSSSDWGSFREDPYVMRITTIPEVDHISLLGVGSLFLIARRVRNR